jgi:hypothetical protein
MWSGTAVSIFFLLFVFSLAERKNEQQVGSTMLPQAKRRMKLKILGMRS